MVFGNCDRRDLQLMAIHVTLTCHSPTYEFDQTAFERISGICVLNDRCAILGYDFMRFDSMLYELLEDLGMLHATWQPMPLRVMSFLKGACSVIRPDTIATSQ